MTSLRALLLALVAGFSAALAALLLGGGSAAAAIAYVVAGIGTLALAGQVQPKQRLVAAPTAHHRHG